MDGKSSENRAYTLYAKKTGWTIDLLPLEEKLKEKALIKEYFINEVKFQILNINEIHSIIENDIKNNKAASIAYFDAKLFVKETIKDYLYKLNLYKTKGERIRQNNNF